MADQSRAGRASLSLALGTISCSAAFEISRIWGFVPYQFQPLDCLLLVGAYLLAFYMYHSACSERTIFACLFVSWASVSGLPVIMIDYLEASILLIVGAVLVFTCLEQRRTLVSLPLLTLLVVLTLFGYSGGTAGAVLGLLALWSVRSTSHSEGALAKKQTEEVITKEFRAEVSWRGFPELYRQSAPGEAEKFCSKVLRDTRTIVMSAGGELVSGTDHRALYTFSSRRDRDLCLSRLSAYENQLLGVLGQVKAPPVSLVFSLK